MAVQNILYIPHRPHRHRKGIILYTYLQIVTTSQHRHGRSPMRPPPNTIAVGDGTNTSRTNAAAARAPHTRRATPPLLAPIPIAGGGGFWCANCLNSGYSLSETILEIIDVGEVAREIICQGTMPPPHRYLNPIGFTSLSIAATPHSHHRRHHRARSAARLAPQRLPPQIQSLCRAGIHSAGGSQLQVSCPLFPVSWNYSENLTPISIKFCHSPFPISH
jgi:hypothetical protein